MEEKKSNKFRGSRETENFQQKQTDSKTTDYDRNGETRIIYWGRRALSSFTRLPLRKLRRGPGDL